MTKGIEEFALEIMELWGPDAWKVSMQSAYAAEQRGEYALERQWREIAAFINPKADTGEKEPILPGLFDRP